MSSFHFSTWPTPYFKYWPQYSFRAAKWFVIRRVVWNYFPKPKMPKKKTCGKNTQIIISFGRENGLEPNFLRLHKIASFSDPTVVSPNPHLMKTFLRVTSIWFFWFVFLLKVCLGKLGLIPTINGTTKIVSSVAMGLYDLRIAVNFRK